MLYVTTGGLTLIQDLTLPIRFNLQATLLPTTIAPSLQTLPCCGPSSFSPPFQLSANTSFFSFLLSCNLLFYNYLNDSWSLKCKHKYTGIYLEVKILPDPVVEKVSCFFAFPKITGTIVWVFEFPFEKWIAYSISEGLTAFYLLFFPLRFIVWKSTRRFYPSVYTQVCIWKSCSEEGKRANKQGVESGEVEVSSCEWKCYAGELVLFFCESVFCETDGVGDVSGEMGMWEVSSYVFRLSGQAPRGMSRGRWAFLEHSGNFGLITSHPKQFQEPLWKNIAPCYGW